MMIKRGVELNGLTTQTLLALIIAEKVLGPYLKSSLVITSVTDGKHGRGSKHYIGNAVDLRIWNMRTTRKATSELAIALGSEFDVVLEKTHLHIEWDPK